MNATDPSGEASVSCVQVDNEPPVCTIKKPKVKGISLTITCSFTLWDGSSLRYNNYFSFEGDLHGFINSEKAVLSQIKELTGYDLVKKNVKIDPTTGEPLAATGGLGKNRRENKAARAARNRAERITGKKFTAKQKKRFHDEISGQDFDYDEMVEVAKEILGN